MPQRRRPIAVTLLVILLAWSMPRTWFHDCGSLHGHDGRKAGSHAVLKGHCPVCDDLTPPLIATCEELRSTLCAVRSAPPVPVHQGPARVDGTVRADRGPPRG